ncbi:Probable RNA-directed DNA polymerase from transposon BS [Eumeta japonica]|uniref:Probable RNA-directed DNA polymerase from transposon BS n=1 Tax=Eumeta variegata TaxID=151549 RepID=A0A4C1ZCP4_EUMVA|nr:Probable RNA-directed DNA polymerase from transposon BS [Eumeta japonica]
MHRRDGTALGLVLVILSKTDGATDIFKSLANVCGLFGIIVEAPYKRGIPGQCHRCQLYGHVVANCHAPPRCVKCLHSHWTTVALAPAGQEVNQPAVIVEAITQQITEGARQHRNPNPKAGTAASAFGDDIGTIMSILQVVRSAEVTDLVARFRKAIHGVDRLKIIWKNQELIIYLPPRGEANSDSAAITKASSPWGCRRPLRRSKFENYILEMKPDNSFALDDRDIAKCLADRVEQQCSNNTIHDTAHSHGIDEEVRMKISLELKCDVTSVSVDEEAVVIGIPKPGKPHDLSARQSLERIRTIIRKTIKIRLSEHLIGKDLIINEQFGFRPIHSCPQQVHRLVEHISQDFKKKHKTVALSFDVAKAFDRVWYAGLIRKLYPLELSDRLALIIQNYLSSQNFTFRHENTLSTKKVLKAGVPQGSILSLYCTQRTLMISRDRRKASNSRYLRMTLRYTYAVLTYETPYRDFTEDHS